MTTLPLRAQHGPNWSTTGFSRALAALLSAVELFNEAQREAATAHKKYPFADW